MNDGIIWTLVGAVGLNQVQNWHPHAPHTAGQHTVTLYSSSATTIVAGSISSSTATMTWAP
jgi:hypothetical protein